MDLEVSKFCLQCTSTTAHLFTTLKAHGRSLKVYGSSLKRYGKYLLRMKTRCIPRPTEPDKSRHFKMTGCWRVISSVYSLMQRPFKETSQYDRLSSNIMLQLNNANKPGIHSGNRLTSFHFARMFGYYIMTFHMSYPSTPSVCKTSSFSSSQQPSATRLDEPTSLTE